MPDEVVVMPQSMLREVVLRLIHPETPPPITGSSEIHLRERQATDSLRPAAARRLHRSKEAIDFLNRFSAQPPLLDEIAGIFLDVAEAPVAHADLLNPYVTDMFVYEEVLYAYRVVVLGASRATMERLMVQLVRGGWHRQAEELATKLDRELTRAEVLRLVQRYTEGATRCRQDDEFWPTFARRHLGLEGENLVRGWISERNQRWAREIW